MFRLDDEHVPLLVLATSHADPTSGAGEGVARLRSEPRTAVVHLNPLTRLEATELARERQPGVSHRPGARPGDRERREPAAGRGAGPRRALVAHAARPTPAHPMMAAVGATLDSLSKPAGARRARHRGARARRRTRPGPHVERHERRRHRRGARRGRAGRGRHHARVQPPDLRAHRVLARVVGHPPRAAHARATVVHEERAVAHHLVAGGALIDDDALKSVRSAGNDALARARGTRPPATTRPRSPAPRIPTELAELHRRAGLSRRGNLQLAQAVTHFEAALHLLGPDADAATRAELHLWRIRCGIGTREMLSVVADREPLEALVDEHRGRRPRAGGRGAGGAVAVVLGRVAHEAGRAVRAPGDGHRRGARRPLRLRARHHRAQRAAVGALRPARFAGDVGGRRRARARRRRRVAARGRPGVPGAARAHLARAASTRPRHARSSAATSPSARSTRWSSACPLAALTQIAVARASSTRPSSTPTGRSCCSASRATTGPPGSSCPCSRARTSARGQFEQAARSTGHVVGDRRRDRADQRRPLLPLGRPRASAAWPCSARPCPACPANRWWAATRGQCWRSSSRSAKAPPATCTRRVTSWPRPSGAAACSSAAPRRWWPATSASRRTSSATRTTPSPPCGAPSPIAHELRAVPELAAAQADLATIHLRRGERGDGFGLLDEAVTTFRRLGLEYDVVRSEQLSGTVGRALRRAHRPQRRRHHPVHRRGRLHPPHRGARRRPLPRPGPAGRSARSPAPSSATAAPWSPASAWATGSSACSPPWRRPSTPPGAASAT